MGLIANFKKGQAAAYAERGVAQGNRKSEPAETGGAGAAGQSDAEELAETRRKLIEELSGEVEKLQKRVGALETERDEAKKLLAEVVAEGEARKKRIAELEAERDAAKKLLADVTASAEQLQKRIAELETEPGVFAEVLLLPGVRKVLLKLFHPDTHPDADEDQRRVLTEGSGKVNAAYALIDKGKKA